VAGWYTSLTNLKLHDIAGKETSAMLSQKEQSCEQESIKKVKKDRSDQVPDSTENQQLGIGLQPDISPCNNQEPNRENFVGRYLRIKSGTYANSLGRVSSQYYAGEFKP
jgi:hypothetical protein